MVVFDYWIRKVTYSFADPYTVYVEIRKKFYFFLLGPI